MTEAAKEPKAKAAPKAAAKKETAPKATPKAPAAKKEAAPKKAPSGKTVTVTQLVGSIARQSDQRATLIGLGLNKRHRTRTLEDTPAVRGMIYKVRHLVKVAE